MDVGGLRAQLERELFLARKFAAMGVEHCQDCGDTGDGELLDGGTCLVLTYHNTCEGKGFATTTEMAGADSATAPVHDDMNGAGGTGDLTAQD
ncbi:hypothetical protein [Vitiosangium sp. GDMCC 1.1324]|uniref:hypothetical protein n=1 Tax=Vitiosangium sp. (strain GDMCC 1.1324) TaxID=2138576 RepID=UPI000D3A96BE|nr:hypothetical protein [Vitiosangium sp. GDMCC 1.1324]PTL80257.1 hypothetical protein DAT35_30145 [Vitiosangium sp. GDMCC 1.1324]